jgi:hypothetical protein
MTGSGIATMRRTSSTLGKGVDWFASDPTTSAQFSEVVCNEIRVRQPRTGEAGAAESDSHRAAGDENDSRTESQGQTAGECPRAGQRVELQEEDDGADGLGKNERDYL